MRKHDAAHIECITWLLISFQQRIWESALLFLEPVLDVAASSSGKEPSRSSRSALVACQVAFRASLSWRPRTEGGDVGHGELLVRETPVNKLLLFARVHVTHSVLRLARLAGVPKKRVP